MARQNNKKETCNRDRTGIFKNVFNISLPIKQEMALRNCKKEHYNRGTKQRC